MDIDVDLTYQILAMNIIAARYLPYGNGASNFYELISMQYWYF
jgi:hypothetical protein